MFSTSLVQYFSLSLSLWISLNEGLRNMSLVL